MINTVFRWLGYVPSDSFDMERVGFENQIMGMKNRIYFLEMDSKRLNKELQVEWDKLSDSFDSIVHSSIIPGEVYRASVDIDYYKLHHWSFEHPELASSYISHVLQGIFCHIESDIRALLANETNSNFR